MRNLPMPEGNINWRNLTAGEDIFDGGNHYQARGSVVCWTGQEAIMARSFLREQAKLTEDRINKWHHDHINSI